MSYLCTDNLRCQCDCGLRLSISREGMVINLRQNTNDDSTAFGKYFAEVDKKEPLNLKGFAKHMTGHGKIADYQMCVLVLGQVVECMSELLSQGQPVKLDGLGTFSPSVDGQGKGKNDLESAVEAGPDAMINGIKINFSPENKGLQGAVRVRVRVCGGERGAHGGRQAEALPEEDPDQLCAGARSRQPGQRVNNSGGAGARGYGGTRIV